MTDVKISEPSRRRGRPPAFDRAAVLARAAETFWRHGYEGSSIADLTEAMGISAQSLYAAFGSKADLYGEALDWYGDTLGLLTDAALERPDVISTLTDLLAADARRFADSAYPPGCMISIAALGCADENRAIAARTATLREGAIDRIANRLERARATGEIVARADPVTIARFVGAIIQGMSVQAHDGASQDALAAVAAMATAQLDSYRPTG